MTDITSSGSDRNLAGNLFLLVCAIGALLGAWYFFTLPTAIDRSILGLKGFAAVANNKSTSNDGLDIRFFSGGRKLDPKQIGLRVLPLYDPNVFRTSTADKSISDDKKETLRSIPRHIFERKIASIPTLVILPKWRTGARRLERLHPDLLIDQRSMRLPIRASQAIGSPEVARQRAGFSELHLQKTKHLLLPQLNLDHTVTLYAAQTMRIGSATKSHCRSVLEAGGDVLLARCEWNARRTGFWLLTDPDVINNHGAGNGDNFRFSVDLVKSLSGGKPVIVDGTSRDHVGVAKTAVEKQRSLADLARFFAYPFSLFWVALAGLSFFTLWHAWRRNGPILDDADDSLMQASKATAIEANVAILRGTGTRGGKDAPLAYRHAAQRMEALGAELLGAHRQKGAGSEEQLIAAIGRRNGSLAQRLADIRAVLTPQGARGHNDKLFNQLNEFEKLIEEARHEFGRPANTRR